MAGCHQRGEEGLQPGWLQEHERPVSLAFFSYLYLSFVINEVVFDNSIFWRSCPRIVFWGKVFRRFAEKQIDWRFCLFAGTIRTSSSSGPTGPSPTGWEMFCQIVTFIVFDIHVVVNVYFINFILIKWMFSSMLNVICFFIIILMK